MFKTDLKTLEKKVEENDKSSSLELVPLRSNHSKPDTAVKTKPNHPNKKAAVNTPDPLKATKPNQHFQR